MVTVAGGGAGGALNLVVVGDAVGRGGWCRVVAGRLVLQGKE